ncbi:purine nucleoside phosphorylase I, inosine and guanosine-specific [Pirellula staleyi DSM 6068]|uniref:Purine nucleoside phosphorylase n=1 Tax=Pirellula staleyi (strain ATCC 27377 / DSM 6068 / ICPB 4128) TaxID=530564 RepID=D2QX64_PIRSD|nr:purine nucleoside phosphorylase I, inosine and guanosine-specific [Pirellula staleyi DSM 6068]
MLPPCRGLLACFNHSLAITPTLAENITMQGIFEKVQEAAAFIKSQWSSTPHAGIILGTGLGSLVDQIEVEAAIDYENIPHFPKSTAISHRGRLVCGKLGKLPVMAMEGRFHMYEGYPLDQVTLPVRVMKAMGANLLVVSNACGGMNPQYRTGDIMLIEDHINLMGANPLIGINDDRLGPRFPDMCHPYEPALIDRALEIARKENIVAHRGVFVAVSGPNLETRAEYRFLRLIGADVVGMSTVPEVIVAVHSNMRVVGFSIITDMCLPDALEPADVQKIIAVANTAQPKLCKLVQGVLAGEQVS